ncbi:MAG: hypothetical protein R6V43_08490 [Halopseudomonas sp.]
MSLHARQTQQAQAHIICHPTHFTGGWVIDEQGREIAITELMVQQACAAWEPRRLAEQAQA